MVMYEMTDLQYQASALASSILFRVSLSCARPLIQYDRLLAAHVFLLLTEDEADGGGKGVAVGDLNGKMVF